MSLYDFTAIGIDGRPVSLSSFRGDVLLIVNVASRCGYTPQYRGLESLFRRCHSRGFSVLGFPCDQFGHQEPGTDAQIHAFCSSTYDVTFPMFSKIDVNGASAHPLFVFLQAEKKGMFGSKRIKWNFTKFLVDRQGIVTKRFAPAESPDRLEADVVALLDA